MAALYRACDALVLPSYGEGFPLVLQEALASELPAVCGLETLRADPAMEAFVRGAAVYPDDPSRTAGEFVHVLDEMLSERAEGGGGYRSFAESRYSWANAADRYLQVFDRVRIQTVTQHRTAAAGVAGNGL
jgi:glycosyltransferase involved in cell wall biosynthesis